MLHVTWVTRGPQRTYDPSEFACGPCSEVTACSHCPNIEWSRIPAETIVVPRPQVDLESLTFGGCSGSGCERSTPLGLFFSFKSSGVDFSPLTCEDGFNRETKHSNYRCYMLFMLQNCCKSVDGESRLVPHLKVALGVSSQFFSI